MKRTKRSPNVTVYFLNLQYSATQAVIKKKASDTNFNKK